MDFATNFKRICNERGTSPTRVCLEIGLSSSKVNLWNKGGLPKADVMVKLAEKLGCSVMDFFADEEDLIPKVEFALDEDEKDIIRLFRMLDRKQKHEFMSKAYAFEALMLKEE
jgi:transcriptional regulator with XRE-family HTH domain